MVVCSQLMLKGHNLKNWFNSKTTLKTTGQAALLMKMITNSFKVLKSKIFSLTQNMK
jgi:hypothetical protein